MAWEFAPLWLTIATGPSRPSISWKMVEKFATAPVAKFASPWQFGPMMRIPARLAVSTSACWTRRPSEPVSPKPEAITTATFTPRAAHASTARTASSPATATMASSGASGRSSTLAKARKPCTVARPGLTG